MKNIDDNLNKNLDKLVDISSEQFLSNLNNIENIENIEDFLKSIKDAYNFKIDDITVKVTFSGKNTLEQQLEYYLKSL